MTPAGELRAAAGVMRERARAVDALAWPGKPWAVTACDTASQYCPCIVYQGQYKPPGEPQVPLIQYVADAETPEHATHIASWHPGVALAVADWLDIEAAGAERHLPDDSGTICAALRIARAYLGPGAP